MHLTAEGRRPEAVRCIRPPEEKVTKIKIPNSKSPARGMNGINVYLLVNNQRSRVLKVIALLVKVSSV